VSAPRECVRNEVECTKEKHESDSKEKLKLYREDLLLRLLLKSKVNREEPRATGASVSECMEFYELLGPSKTFWLGEMVWREWEDKQAITSRFALPQDDELLLRRFFSLFLFRSIRTLYCYSYSFTPPKHQNWVSFIIPWN
jgi:hypothetical protein